MRLEAIDFKVLLLENYKKLELTELEATTILMIDYLINEGNDFITADLLSLKMTADVKDLDNVLANLLKRNFLEFAKKGNKTVTTLNPLKNKLYKELESFIDSETERKNSEEIKQELLEIYKNFEDIFERNPKPIEKQKVHDWLRYGIKKDVIIEAFKEAASKGRKTINSVDKILMSWCKRDDFEAEGKTVQNINWDKNLEETIRIAKTPWLDTDDDK